MMDIVFDRAQAVPPKLSIILLDWSCRESFHTLHYLERQTVPRDAYEVIWIEYYGRHAQGIKEALKESERNHRPPVVDRWIVLGIPEDVYYHKHLMYNVGIVAARGQILTICDSDAMMRPTFIESILSEFEHDPKIVLHMDEVRNNDRRFYPFSYPTFEQVLGPGAINWTGTTTTGLADREDTLHSRNYGACMVARRDDIIAIGGADEHIDYLGHICGPYELTFRLVNAGKREVWHPHEFLYHTWHPGQAGAENYLGPHDGRHMSTTALHVRRTGRILPLVENAAVRALRLGEGNVSYASLFDRLIPDAEVKSWTVANAERLQASTQRRVKRLRDSFSAFALARLTFKILARQMWLKVTQLSRRSASKGELMGKAFKAYAFARVVLTHHGYVLRQTRAMLSQLADAGVQEVAVFGASEVAEMVIVLAPAHGIRVAGIYERTRTERVMQFSVQPVELLAEYSGIVVVASVVGVEDRLNRLKRVGVPSDKIVRLC